MATQGCDRRVVHKRWQAGLRCHHAAIQYELAGLVRDRA